MAARLPPVPPRPYNYDNDTTAISSSRPPPVPPLPPNYVPDDAFDSPPHLQDPLVAPRPQRFTPDAPADMARTLDEQVAYSPYPPPRSPQPPQQPAINLNPGFFVPGFRGPSPAPPPPPPGAGWSSPPLPMPYVNGPRNDSLSSSMASLSFGPAPGGPRPRVPSSYGSPAPSYPAPAQSPQQPQQPQQMPPEASAPPSLTAPLPTISALQAAQQAVQAPSCDPASKIAWCRDVLSLVNRATQAAAGGVGSSSGQSGTDPIAGPARISDPNLQRLADVAVPLVLGMANAAQQPQSGSSKLSPPVAEAIYHRAVISAAGSFPQFIPPNPRTAFRDFELAARSGYYAAWFRLGRDYENFGDDVHARDCFERGVKYSVESCIYRMGMAHLMGQLGLPASAEIAVPLLHRAAAMATIDVPQPAYVYGLLLLEEFKHVAIPAALFAPLVPAGSSIHLEARKHLERAAYLNFAPAQYKLGHAYEFALAPFPYDALLSVQYYSLASQQGEVEADMALSKWFLCGAEGSFEKDEALAFTFAEKAARKGLPSAEFAMGYYKEVGIGCAMDLESAKKWYTRAAEHGNTDATERLAALNQASPQQLSRQEHETITDNKLVRTRTQAKQRSDAAGRRQQTGRPGQASEVVEIVRRNSRMDHSYHPRANSFASGDAGPPSSFQQPPPPSGGGSGQNSNPQHPAHAQTMPPSNYPPPGGPPSQSQVQNNARFPTNRPRYTLTDGPSPSSSSLGQIPEGPGPSGLGPGAGRGGRTASPAPGRGGRGGRLPSGSSPPRQQQQQQQSATSSPSSQPEPLPPPTSAPPPQTPPGPQAATKYQSFAEMGFQSSSKAEDKDCVIM